MEEQSIGLAKYKDIFGKPKEGIHALRFCGLAFWDLFLTLVFVIVFSYVTKYNPYYVFAITFGLGIVLHKLFSVDTTINKTIFGPS